MKSNTWVEFPDFYKSEYVKRWWEEAYRRHQTQVSGYQPKDKPANKYLRDYPHKTIDIYRVLEVYEVTDPAIQHAIKKLLCAGQRGYKEKEKDVEEAIQALERWQQMRDEEIPF